jgi:hypothetical protein
MVYLIFNIIAASSSLIIIKDRNIFFNCPAKIETLSIVSPVFILNSTKAVDRFFVVLSIFVKSLA